MVVVDVAAPKVKGLGLLEGTATEAPLDGFPTPAGEAPKPPLRDCKDEDTAPNEKGLDPVLLLVAPNPKEVLGGTAADAPLDDSPTPAGEVPKPPLFDCKDEATAPNEKGLDPVLLLVAPNPKELLVLAVTARPPNPRELG